MANDSHDAPPSSDSLVAAARMAADSSLMHCFPVGRQTYRRVIPPPLSARSKAQCVGADDSHGCAPRSLRQS